MDCTPYLIFLKVAVSTRLYTRCQVICNLGGGPQTALRRMSGPPGDGPGIGL